LFLFTIKSSFISDSLTLIESFEIIGILGNIFFWISSWIRCSVATFARALLFVTEFRLFISFV
jgi:hypothetical protein